MIPYSIIGVLPRVSVITGIFFHLLLMNGGIYKEIWLSGLRHSFGMTNLYRGSSAIEFYVQMGHIQI